MKESTFLKKYKNLNPEQKKAVDAIEGPVMVIAGPGTGKTTILTLRIANILQKTDTQPEQILALTFTESGVYSMRKNLVALIGARAYRVRIATFHSFCNDIIKKYPEAFETIIGGTHIGAVEQIRTLETIIEKLPLHYLKPAGDPYFFISSILRRISDLKREGITPTLLKKQIQTLYSDEQKTKKKSVVVERTKKEIDSEKQREKSFEFLTLYETYETETKKKKEYDYDDMIMEVLVVLSKNTDVLRELQEEYHYILADEHQDVNGAQNKVLERLAEFHAPYPNLFIVGDEKQAIFRFQGASLENFLYFQKQYPQALCIPLTKNYRSGQTILDAAGSLIEKGDLSHMSAGVKLTSHTAHKTENIMVRSFSKREYELAFIVEEIKNLISLKKVSPHEIGILYRDNKDAAPIVRILEKADIPFSVYSDENILLDPELQKLATLLFAVNYLGDDAYLIPALWIDFLKLYPLDIYTISDTARKKKISVLSVIHSLPALAELPLKKREALFMFAEKLIRFKHRAENVPFTTLLEEIVHESGFMEYLLTRPDAPYVLDKLHVLYESVAESSMRHKKFTLAQFIEELSIREKYNISIKRKDEGQLTESVQLMTAHRSKGLEFSYVYIVGAEDKHWGGRKVNDPLALPIFGEKEKTLDDERRLFYVALTRAKKSVTVSYAEKNIEGGALLPSQFIEEIDEVFRTRESLGHDEKKLKHTRLTAPVSHTRISSRIPRLEKAYLQKRFHDQGLSITALNNFIECPWKYFYVNLLRIPRIQKPHQMYGTAIHEGLNVLFENIRRGKKVDKKTAVQAFITSFKKFPLSKSVFDQYKEKGVKALSGYFVRYNKSWNTNVLLEFPIGGVFSKGAIRLTGKLDKIEFLGSGNEVNVVDYKTGKHHSRNHLEGKTKSGTGNEKRQLIFYKLLLDLFSKNRFNMTTGLIDFVEPDERGVYHREQFVITPEDTEALSILLEEKVAEILSFSFWNTTCEKKDCEFCALRKLTGAQLVEK
jgi:DNA helicase-2/ATP-dependent DNA helicase PcrA